MSTIADELKQATRAAGRSTPTKSRIEPGPTAFSPVVAPRTATPQRSREMGLVVQAILFCAATLSLVAVIQQARANDESPGTGVADPPPAVFVNVD